MNDKDYIGQMWGNKLYIMRYKMKPEKITFNPYKNEYEKLLEQKKNRKFVIFFYISFGFINRYDC